MAATVVSVVIFSAACSSAAACAPSGTGASMTRRRCRAADRTPQLRRAAGDRRQPDRIRERAAASAAGRRRSDSSYFNRLENTEPAGRGAEAVGERSRTEGHCRRWRKPAPVPEKPRRSGRTASQSRGASDGLGAAAPTARGARYQGGSPRQSPSRGRGFAVQIAALNVRSEADAIARRLSSKGYAAYVLSPANGTPSVYRVRVGKFRTRREAETIATKLQKEEQFKPWITR